MNFKKLNTPNFSKALRKSSDIKFIIIHYTGMQSKIESIKRLTSSKSKVSCHYLIDRGGKIMRLVDDKKVAWHAGKSRWKRFVNLNHNSIGIELINKGHKHGYQNYTNTQINSLIKLCLYLRKKFKINKSNILGHSDISPQRKQDPGEKFPWKKLNQKKIGDWYKLPSKIRLKNTERKNLEKLFFKNLFKIGYRYFNQSKKLKNDVLVIKAFQRHFVQAKITGKIDSKTYEISHLLANK
ncbi:N-acetylmuramoyl-L-alanine amidase [Candidatus Pelagibacter bacterium]|nr:N-acetylmuramoyl-L-alanine amidase [Candidatus Pelagibacter bacterium]